MRLWKMVACYPRRPVLLVLLGLFAAASTACGYDHSPGGATDEGGGENGAPGADADPSADDAGATDPDAAVGVACGGATCTGTQVCCSTMTGGTVTQACTEPGDCQGEAAACDGPEDCQAGQICCESSGAGAACQDQNQICQFELCHSSSDCSVAGEICCPLQGRSACTKGTVCPGPPI